MRCPKCSSENVQIHYEVEKQGFSGGKGCCGWILLGPIGLLCGLCGKGKIKSEEKYWVCNNCGAKFSDTQIHPKNQPPHTPNSSSYNDSKLSSTTADNNNVPTASQILFDYSTVPDLDGDSAVFECCSLLFSIINSNFSKDDYISLLNTASGQHVEWATQYINADLLQKTKQNISIYLESDEEVIFYKDSGVLSKGKSGIFITSKKIISMNKEKINIINLSEISSIHFIELIGHSCEWYFNYNKNIMIDNMVCNPKEQSLIMAFICTLIRDCHPNGFKINLLKGSL